MELKEAIEKCKKYTQNSLDIWAIPSSYECEELRIAINTVLEELNNRISKEILEEYLAQAEERYKTYKEASKENEGCKGGMWKYLGEVNILKRILGKSIDVVTLDKE